MTNLELLRLHAAEQLGQLLNPALWTPKHTLTPDAALQAIDAIEDYLSKSIQQKIPHQQGTPPHDPT